MRPALSLTEWMRPWAYEHRDSAMHKEAKVTIAINNETFSLTVCYYRFLDLLSPWVYRPYQ